MNRTGLMSKWEVTPPNRKPLFFAVIDLDFFGSVNKVFGKRCRKPCPRSFYRIVQRCRAEDWFSRAHRRRRVSSLGSCFSAPDEIFLDRFREQFVHALKSPSFLREVRKLKDPKAKMSEWKPPSFTAGVAGTKSHTRKFRMRGFYSGEWTQRCNWVSAKGVNER